jgi:uncharacterized tellurite resistance protein B-like protein
MINIKRIRIQPKEGRIEVKDRNEMEKKRHQVAELFGVKPGAISLIYVEDEESIKEAQNWHHFTQPMYSL